MKKIFYGLILVTTTIVLFLTYTYFEAKESVLNGYLFKLRRRYPPIDRKKVEIRFKTISLSKTEIIHFWFLEPYQEISDRGVAWGLYSWKIDYSTTWGFSDIDIDIPNPDELEIKVEIKKKSKK